MSVHAASSMVAIACRIGVVWRTVMELVELVAAAAGRDGLG
jgi:hypothetical protein